MSILKAIGRILGTIRALPPITGFVLGSLILGRQRAFAASSERISRVPGNLGVFARQVYYQLSLLHVGRDVHFGFLSVFSKPQARLGDRVYIGRFCTIGWADIGDDVMLADGVQILSGGHQHGRSAGVGTLHDNPHTYTQVTIGKGAWLGAGAIIMADVGEHAIVAAGAVVTKPVPANARVAGIPARPLKAEGLNDPG